MSTMSDWAEREVELACKRENPDRKPGEWDYGCACYESALKAYKILLEDDHSGASWSITTEILYRLLKDLPLTPINEEDFPDHDKFDPDGDSIQCPRMFSLFKMITPNGIQYHDIDRCYCYTIDNPKIHFGGSHTRIIDELFPITLPYFPKLEKYKLEMEEFLYDKDNPGYDTWAYLSVRTPEGDIVPINRYFRGPTQKELKNYKGTEPLLRIEITEQEYLDRKSQS